MNKLLILLIFIILTVFVSCNKNEAAADNDKNETEPTDNTVTEEIKNPLPDLDFKGETLNLLIRGDVTLKEEFYAEEENGDLFNDVIFRRNKTVEERLNMNLNVILGNMWDTWLGDMHNTIRNSIFAGDNAYDIIADWGLGASVLAVQGVYLDIYRLPYLNLANPWWNKSMPVEGEIAGKLFYVAGDITTTNITSAYVYFFNKKIQQNYDIPDLYQLVIDGKWTNDYMVRLVSEITSDLNGDGILDENDLYGIAMDTLNSVDPFLHSSNIRMFSRDESGLPVLNLEYEKLSSLINKLYSLLFENAGCYTIDVSKIGLYEANMFKNNQVFLIGRPLNASYTSFRDMDTDYGILPPPKYDEKQAEYYTRSFSDVGTFMCVAISTGKTELAGAFLESAAFENHYNVVPVLYETALKVKFTRDDMSAKMLDIIREGIYFNFASIYNMNIGNPWWVLRDLLTAKNNNFASWYESNEIKIQTSLDKMVETIENMQ